MLTPEILRSTHFRFKAMFLSSKSSTADHLPILNQLHMTEFSLIQYDPTCDNHVETW